MVVLIRRVRTGPNHDSVRVYDLFRLPISSGEVLDASCWASIASGELWRGPLARTGSRRGGGSPYDDPALCTGLRMSAWRRPAWLAMQLKSSQRLHVQSL